MLILFVIFWAALGVGVFFIAMRGGPKGARAALHTDCLLYTSPSPRD